MNSTINDEKSKFCSIIISSQHLAKKSNDSIENIVSDICGLQYDPNPTIHLNHYMMLWNRKKDFDVEDLDVAAYKEFKITEAFTFKRNMFFVPTNEFAIYRAALKDVVRWGQSDESWLAKANNPIDIDAELELKSKLKGQVGMTTNEIWEFLNLSNEWDSYVKARRAGDLSYELPIFRAFYRLKRKTDLVTCGRNPGTFKEPLYILKENIGITEWQNSEISKDDARAYIIEKLISAFGVTYPVHISHITGIPTIEVTPYFSKLEQEGRILSFKFGKKLCYIHSSKKEMLDSNIEPNNEEIRLISPMDILVRDQAWLKLFFDYSYTFEYFKKKGMKWPLSILVGNKFVGYFDCKMDRKTNEFIIKEKNIFDPAFKNHKCIELALQDLADFHGAKEIVEK